MEYLVKTLHVAESGPIIARFARADHVHRFDPLTDAQITLQLRPGSDVNLSVYTERHGR
jgi:hypothetical protein